LRRYDGVLSTRVGYTGDGNVSHATKRICLNLPNLFIMFFPGYA
jgi:hypothetical protein